MNAWAWKGSRVDLVRERGLLPGKGFDMRRSKNGLQWTQNRFLRAVLRGKSSVPGILKTQGIPLSRLHKWMDEPAFREALTKVRQMVAMLREMNMEIGALVAVKVLTVSLLRDTLSGTQLKAGAVLMKAPRKLNGREKKVDEGRVISEREFVRSISGEEGVKAYDELVAM